MKTDSVLDLLLRANQLKRIPRTGWVMRGVADAESVADHSFGVAFVSLILAELVDQPLDKTKLLTIALLHDLPESVVSDLPTSATVHFPPGAKRKAETEALSALLCGFLSLPKGRLDCADQWHAWWQEFEDGTSVEGRLVRDADRLDMLIQAHVYEQTTGNRWLEEFWPRSEDSPFEFAAFIQPTLTVHHTNAGTFYSIGGEVCGGPGRPIQPRATVPITGPSGGGHIAHGALLVGGTFHDELAFDPLVARPITDTARPEPDFDAGGWFPSRPWLLNRFSGQDRLVVVPGQYNQQGGTERLYDELELLIYYSTDYEDFLPPVIWDVLVEHTLDEAGFEVFVSDDAGVYRVVVTYDEGDGEWKIVDLTREPGSNRWVGEVDDASLKFPYFVQAVDGVGNVAVGANKGLLFEAAPNMVFLPLVLREY